MAAPGGQACRARLTVCLMAAPSRASACRRSSSSISGSVRAMRLGRGGIGRRAAAGGARGRSGACRSRRPADRLPAEEAVDPLQDDAGQVLDFERGRAFDPQHQGAGLGGLGRRAARGHWIFTGSAVGGDLRPDDVGPARHQFGRGEALPGERIAQRLAERVRTAAGRAFWRACSWRHGSAIDRPMTLAAPNAGRSAPRRRESVRQPPERPRPTRRRCSPGTTATAACCRGARGPARRPIPTASGCPRSCCSRPP